MNFRNLIDEVSSDFSTTIEPRAKVWINASYHEFLSYHRWSFLETTSSAVPLSTGVQTYDLLGGTPVVSDYAGMISVELEMSSGGARNPLREMDPQTMMLTTSHSRVNGTPTFWCTVGGPAAANAAAIVAGGRQQLYLWPIPTAAASQGVNVFIRYDRGVMGIELSADTDIPIIGAQYHMALVYGAKSIGFDAMNQTDQGATQRGLFMQRLLAAQTEDASMRMRDLQRMQLVQQPWRYPIQGDPPPGTPPPADPYPPRH